MSSAGVSSAEKRGCCCRVDHSCRLGRKPGRRIRSVDKGGPGYHTIGSVDEGGREGSGGCRIRSTDEGGREGSGGCSSVGHIAMGHWFGDLAMLGFLLLADLHEIGAEIIHFLGSVISGYRMLHVGLGLLILDLGNSSKTSGHYLEEIVFIELGHDQQNLLLRLRIL